MASSGVVEPVDVLEDGGFSLSPSRPSLTPDQFRLQRFEECLDRGVIITISLAAHRWQQAMGLQLLLIIVRTILATAIRMEKAAWRRIAQAHGHVQRPDSQILLHPVADSPAHNAAAIQIKDDSQVEPSLGRPDIGDVSYGFASVQLRFRQPISGWVHRQQNLRQASSPPHPGDDGCRW